MKKTLLTLMLITAFIATTQANAATVISQDTVSAATPGFYVAVHAVKGALKAENFEYSLSGYAVNNTIAQSNTNGFGASAGYQDSQINDVILQALQVKRVSYGLELDQTSSNLQGSTNLIGTSLANLSARYKSTAVFAMAKVNVFQFWHFSPYLEAGIGLMRQELSNHQDDYNGFGVVTFSNSAESGMASQMGVGLDLFITPHINASVGYRYVNAGHLTLAKQSSMGTLSNAPALDTNQNQWLANVAYDF